ncbi:MAG: efflux RND transporter periplasmic adaptor subunit [Anaerolineae bacterium]|nr:efflux RND transporter periplasmic adaptor subunit [Anaerolineae bacterium]
MWIGGIVLLLIMVAAAALPRLASGAAARQQETLVDDSETVTAVIGDLSANATASGKVQAQRAAQLALAQSGTVAEVFVQVGDAVTTDDPLLKLDTAALERAVLNAEQSLVIQEANLAALREPASAADLAAAEANAASAEVALSEALAGPSENEIAQAEANLRAAEAEIAAAAAQLSSARSGASEAELQAAQIQLNLAQTAATQAAEQHSGILVTEAEGFLTAEMLSDMEFAARTQALQANANLAAAQETVNQLLNGDSSSIATASAQVALAAPAVMQLRRIWTCCYLALPQHRLPRRRATLAQAQANVDQLRRGPAESQLVQMETAVEQARIALQRAQNNLAEATLTAPFAGTVTAVHVHAGEEANGILVEMVDPASLEVVLDVDEVDIGKINEGQPATLTLESWPDVEITAEVVSIAPTTTQDNSAVVSYQVYLRLGENDLPVLVGMTANANLITDEVKDVLLVPNGAITANREKGTFTVNRMTTDAEGVASFEEVEVTIGLRDGRFTQITSGLNEGDELLVGTLTPRFQFGNGDGPPEGGGGGPFGGG